MDLMQYSSVIMPEAKPTSNQFRFTDKADMPRTGYTGCLGNTAKFSARGKPHELDVPLKKDNISGYSGHLPLTHAKGQIQKLARSEKRVEPEVVPEDSTDEFKRNINMDFMERYSEAALVLESRNQSHQMLLRIVQAKLSQQVSSYAQQLIRVRKLFEAFDMDNNGVLDEFEFREFLEQINVQFDDVQILALFSYFDESNTGVIVWEEFARHAMIHNPKGGTAVLTKPITATVHSGCWHAIQECEFKVSEGK